MIYLDTHVVVWLYSGLTDKFSATAQELINDNETYISPIVRLELQYLFEVQRVAEAPDTIVRTWLAGLGYRSAPGRSIAL